MSVADSPTRDVRFVPETPPSSSHSNEPSQEQVHLSKKPRNYKYWSDDEVKKILNWLTLPENDGKLARNKAQACREVAKKLFDGDEYMAISVRSKLMSLEKGFREAEQLRLQLNTCTKDEALINEKIKEVSKFHKQCKQLFGNQRTDGYVPPISTSPIASNNTSIPTPSSSTIPYSPNSRPSHHVFPPLPPPQQQQQLNVNGKSSVLPRPDCDSPSSSSPSAAAHNASSNSTVLPHLNEDRLRALSIPPHLMRGAWSLPRVAAVDLPPVEDDPLDGIKKRKLSQESSISNSHSAASSVRIARYAAKEASYKAKQAEYEALKSDYERSKMEYAIRLAEIELDRDALSIKRLELELQLAQSRDKSQHQQLPQ
ncbi:hypothetical protein FB192DRAFT_1374822 [Mucor lusitanicus]|uniref:Uncharacterized protein n=2 Tax=Mucor circinelloides f. lusitanicus TaxID=29924 RepID=A0A162ZTB0_MUCCL|nr:hypothetical protein FB192DRAFT_1374822 [Mucor lusitanicus]OAD07687.1 hypothetical protein MUCCIDRAFT_104627 [Mucor lusitanicus CBS 277.49]